MTSRSHVRGRQPRPLSCADATTPFASAEEAWLWFWQCQIARDDGARVVAGAGAVVRPCDPDDLYRAAARLHRSGILERAHLAVLGRFGRLLTPPDARLPGQARPAALWREGLERLETLLRGKGIVA